MTFLLLMGIMNEYNIIQVSVQWVLLNIIPSVHEKIMTLSGTFYCIALIGGL